jgi:hypothetical protein
MQAGTDNTSKVAIMTDKKWLSHIVKLEDKLFPSIDIQCFNLEEQELAVEFLRA